MTRFLLAIALLLGACTGAPSATPTLEQRLAVINEDDTTADEFKAVLDRLQAGGECRGDPDREGLADTMVASWQKSPKRITLLEFAQALADVCGA